jgi:hypothetical protein
VVECGALEMRFGATQRGFESLPLRLHKIAHSSMSEMMHEDNLEDNLIWTKEAIVKLKNIPFFVRTQARQRIEALARAANCEEVTAELVEQARSEFGQ